MDPRFLTGFQQMAEEQMIAGQQRMNPTAGGKLDGGDPYSDPSYRPSRSYQEGFFFDQDYISKANELLASMQKPTEAVPESITPGGIG